MPSTKLGHESLTAVEPVVRKRWQRGSKRGLRLDLRLTGLYWYYMIRLYFHLSMCFAQL